MKQTTKKCIFYQSAAGRSGAWYIFFIIIIHLMKSPWFQYYSVHFLHLIVQSCTKLIVTYTTWHWFIEGFNCIGSSQSFSLIQTLHKSGKQKQTNTYFGHIFCDRPLVAFKTDLNLTTCSWGPLRKCLGPTTPGTFPCTAAKCKACPYLCADTSVQGPSGHMQVRRSFTCPKRQPGLFDHLSDLRDDACGRDCPCPCDPLHWTSRWHPPYPQQISCPTL